MISHQLPEQIRITRPAPLAPTTVFHARTQDEYHYPTHQTPYLLICNFGSCGNYVLNQEPIQANEQLFYFANPKDELEICFEGKKARETLLILFDRAMVCEAAASWERSPEYLLEHPFGDSGEALIIPPVPFSYTTQFRKSLKDLCDGEGLIRHEVLSQFIRLQSEVRRSINGVRAQKASTRQEIYKCLALARAFMEANVDEQLAIAPASGIYGD